MESRSIFSPSRNGPNDIRNSGPMSPREPPACVQNAMAKEKKPFTYTPGGLDLSEIRSEKMARRLMINAMSPGVQEKPKPPSFTPTSETPPPVKPALHYFNMPVAVFPCIQIPANPKELLRRTSGPYNRSESVEKREFSPQKQTEKKVNGFAVPERNTSGKCEKVIVPPPSQAENVVSETSEKVDKTVEPIIEEVQPKTNKLEDVKRETPRISPQIVLERKNEPIEEKPIENEPTVNKVEEQEQQEEVEEEEEEEIEEEEVEEEEEEEEEEVAEQTKFVDDKIDDDQLNIQVQTNIETQCTNEDDTQDEVITNEKVDEKSKSINEYVDNECIKDIVKEEIIQKESEVEKLINHIPVFKEERSPSPFRKSMEIIKGLTDDLDKLPSLDICPKRFSFLRDSPSFDGQKTEEEEEDPFRILTGIPPKISLIDRVDIKKKEEVVAPIKIEIQPPPWTCVVNEIHKKDQQTEEKKTFEPTWKKVNILKEDFRAPSPFKASDADGFWKKDLWNEPARQDSVSPIPSFLKDDPEPAWKKELRDIAIQKAENKDDVEFKSNEEPPWRRELRELSQARGAKSLPIKEINLEEVIDPPWKLNVNQYRPPNVQDKPKSSPPPTWSQTLRPKSWKERTADLATERPVHVPEWKRASSPKTTTENNYTKSPMDRLSILATKTPEITVEVVNQPPYKSVTLPSNGYVYPWESSSDSSAAFSPEPRTPTPQSRNSPFTHGSQNSMYNYASTIPREYGTLSFQPRRPVMRSCPIQSRSFKYLQQLTGTDDSYEDDEPFIPQPAQHALPRPENL